MLPLLIIGSILLISLTSLAGAALLVLSQRTLRSALLILVSFSTGAMLGNVFLHLLPEISSHSEHDQVVFSLVLAGLLGSFMIEKFIHWRHCHDVDCAAHVHPAGPLILLGDAAHNLVDGILIATGFLVSTDIGIATTVAVLLHEIPQELGDFIVLLHSGYTKAQALLCNAASALTALLGGALVLFFNQSISNAEYLLLPLAAGNFLYIAGSDLLPALHKETAVHKTALQLLSISAGILLMWSLLMLEH